MAYKSDSIVTIIHRLNVNYYLPAIQREFVWHSAQIITLFDSIMRGYPIGSFLFWELKPENREKWEVYKFVDHFKQSGTHNEHAQTDGVQQLTLVLDGQQRLTALLIGLKGAYTAKKKYKHWDSPDAWIQQRLYIDLLKDPKTGEDGEAGIRYGLRFVDGTPKPEKGRYWLKVGQILNYDSEERFYEFRQNERERLPEDTTKGQMSVFERNLERLYRAVWKDDVISYYTELDQDYDRVLDIFVRANEGGTKLGKSDLLLSMVISKWGGIDARDEIFNFVDRINGQIGGKNNLDKDFIMKSCLVLSDLPVQYKVENFNIQNLARIQGKWKTIKVAIESAVKLTNSFGIDRDTLTSANALIPIIYYFHRRPGVSLLGLSKFEVSNASRIRRWLLTALLNNVFGGQSDNLLRDIRRILQDSYPDKDFPLDSINAEVAKSGRSAYFNDDAIANLLRISYGKQLTFLALSLLYDENGWGTTTYHVDHIFPRSLFTRKNMEKASISKEKQIRYLGLVDRVANLELLRYQENLEKSDQRFEDWLPTRNAIFRQLHLIPDGDGILSFEEFEQFFKAREVLIVEKLKQLLNPGNAGKPD